MWIVDLEKTYTIKQLLMRCFLFIVVVILIDFCLAIRRGWNTQMGGVGIGNTPYKVLVTKECLKFIDVHRGLGSRNPVANIGKIGVSQPRTYVTNINEWVERSHCDGYQILAGLHGDQWASYRFVYLNDIGEPTVIETVEYHTERQPSHHTQRR